jgi:signal transduction histidine kinase
MGPDPEAQAVYARLRRSVATDVRQARREFCALLLDPDRPVGPVLELASRPGEGRVRHMIATAVRVEPLTTDAQREMAAWLRRWEAVESDEFAKGAVVSALAAIEPADPPAPTPAALPAEFMAAYRFAAERLCHRLRQGFVMPAACVLQLEQLLGNTADPAVRMALGDVLSRLRPALQRLSRLVEFDTTDAHVQWTSLALAEWLNVAAAGFTARYGPATLTLIGTEAAKRARVRAMPLLLDTLFGNLWVNAVQIADGAGHPSCSITVELNVVDQSLDILVRDGGPGFPTRVVGHAFRQPFSTKKSETGGRGLLEVADAVKRLEGTVRLVPVAAEEFRILIRLPVDVT